MKKLAALKYTEKDGSIRDSGDAAARATSHTSIFVVTNYCANRINVNHPLGNLRPCEDPSRGQKSISSVGRLSGVSRRVALPLLSLILKCTTEIFCLYICSLVHKYREILSFLLIIFLEILL